MSLNYAKWDHLDEGSSDDNDTISSSSVATPNKKEDSAVREHGEVRSLPAGVSAVDYLIQRQKTELDPRPVVIIGKLSAAEQRKLNVVNSLAALTAAAKGGVADSVDPRSELRAPVISCAKCSTFKQKNELKFCARCMLTGYCSKECQNADWKVHKKYCSAPAHGTARSQSAVNEVMRVVARCVDKLSFDFRYFFPGDDYDDVPQGIVADSFASCVMRQRDKHGEGMLLLHFENVAACEDVSVRLSLLLQNRSVGYERAGSMALHGVKVLYLLWPLSRNTAVWWRGKSGFEATFSALSEQCNWADIMTVARTADSQFVFCFSIAPGVASSGPQNVPITQCYCLDLASCTPPTACSSASASAASAGRSGSPDSSSTEDHAVQEQLGRPPRTFRAQDAALALARRIETDEAFRECRDILFKIQDEEHTNGLFWLCRFSNVGSVGFSSAKELSVVTPTSFKVVCQQCSLTRQKTRKQKQAAAAAAADAPGVIHTTAGASPTADETLLDFYHLQGRDLTTLQHIAGDFCDEALLDKLRRAKEEQKVLGFFLTYPLPDNDVCILTFFTIKRV